MEETAKKLTNEIWENIKERFFSPMYLYFGVAWLITNWEFSLGLLILDQEYLGENKIYFLKNIYSFDGLLCGLWSISRLLLIPIASMLSFVWILPFFSDKILEKTEKNRGTAMVITKIANTNGHKLLKEALENAKKEGEEEGKEKVRKERGVEYNDHPSFNYWIDNAQENISIGDSEYLPSKVLYDTDIVNYKNELIQFDGNPQYLIDALELGLLEESQDIIDNVSVKIGKINQNFSLLQLDSILVLSKKYPHFSLELSEIMEVTGLNRLKKEIEKIP